MDGTLPGLQYQISLYCEYDATPAPTYAPSISPTNAQTFSPTTTRRRSLLQETNAPTVVPTFSRSDDPNSEGYCKGDVCFRLVEQFTTMANEINTYSFDPIGYADNCETSVQAVAPNCDSDSDFQACVTYIDCPEVPEVSCDLTVEEDDDGLTAITIVIEEPSTGNVEHIASWDVAYITTVEGPRICAATGGREVACASYIPTFGLAGCIETISEACGGAAHNEDFGDASTTLWEACPTECMLYSGLSESVTGTVV